MKVSAHTVRVQKARALQAIRSLLNKIIKSEPTTKELECWLRLHLKFLFSDSAYKQKLLFFGTLE